MFLNLKHVPNTTRLALKSRLVRAYQRSRWCEWQMSDVSCATVVVIRSKCKTQRWRMSSSCPNTRSFHSVSPLIFLFPFFFLTVQTPSFRVSRDDIARPEQTKPIRLSRLGLDKLIGIKEDKGEGAAPSDTSKLCRCIRLENSLGCRLERIGDVTRMDPVLGCRGRSSRRPWDHQYRIYSFICAYRRRGEYQLVVSPSTDDDTSLVEPVRVRRNLGEGFN